MSIFICKIILQIQVGGLIMLGAKNNRILTIYTKLLNGEIINKAQIAEEYKVNQRSIQRDIENIRTFLDSLVVDNGIVNNIIYDYANKGYRLEKVAKMKFSNQEILAVSKILLDSRAFDKNEMNIILDKLLECCVPPQEQKLVNDLIANEKFHYIEPQHKKYFLDTMWQIGMAIKESRLIEIEYKKLKDKQTVKRELQPMAIMFSEFYFYVVGFIQGIDKEKAFEYANDPFPTIYRVDRIEKLKVTDKHFRIPYKDRFEEGEFRKRIQFMYGGKLQTVKFEYTGLSIESVLDRLPTAKILSEDEGRYIVQAEVFGKGIDMWIRGQGEVVKLID